MGGAHPNGNQAAGKGNDPRNQQGLPNDVPEWGAYVGDMAPWNRYPWGTVTPCKRFSTVPVEDCTTRRSTCTALKGRRWKMGFVVCIVSHVCHMIPPLILTLGRFNSCVPDGVQDKFDQQASN